MCYCYHFKDDTQKKCKCNIVLYQPTLALNKIIRSEKFCEERLNFFFKHDFKREIRVLNCEHLTLQEGSGLRVVHEGRSNAEMANKNEAKVDKFN